MVEGLPTESYHPRAVGVAVRTYSSASVLVLNGGGLRPIWSHALPISADEALRGTASSRFLVDCPAARDPSHMRRSEPVPPLHAPPHFRWSQAHNARRRPPSSGVAHHRLRPTRDHRGRARS